MLTVISLHFVKTGGVQKVSPQKRALYGAVLKKITTFPSFKKFTEKKSSAQVYLHFFEALNVINKME